MLLKGAVNTNSFLVEFIVMSAAVYLINASIVFHFVRIINKDIIPLVIGTLYYNISTDLKDNFPYFNFLISPRISKLHNNNK